IAHECGRDDNGSGTYHANRNCHQKVALIEPAVFVYHALLEEGNDYQAASEGESSRLEKEQQQLSDRGRVDERGCRAGSNDRYSTGAFGTGWRSTQERAVAQDSDRSRADEYTRDLG